MSSKIPLDVIAISVAVLSAVFAGAAAVFAGLQWSDARELGRLSNEATVVVDVDSEPGRSKRGIIVRNAGPGIAHIKTVRYYVDGRLLTDINIPFDRFAGLDSSRLEEIEINGDAMSPNERQQILRFDASKSEQVRAKEFFENRLNVTVAYCAAGGRCETVCSDRAHCGEIVGDDKKRQ